MTGSPPDPGSGPPPRGRRPRYAGTHPRRFDERCKERDPDKYPDVDAHVRAQGRTPAGTHVPIMVAEVLAALRPAQLLLHCFQILPHSRPPQGRSPCSVQDTPGTDPASSSAAADTRRLGSLPLASPVRLPHIGSPEDQVGSAGTLAPARRVRVEKYEES